MSRAQGRAGATMYRKYGMAKGRAGATMYRKYGMSRRKGAQERRCIGSTGQNGSRQFLALPPSMEVVCRERKDALHEFSIRFLAGC